MITANELRVGNLIFWNPKLSNPNTTLPAMQVEVSAILEDKIGYVSPGIEYRVESFEDDLLQKKTPYKLLEELEPILLTHEILERCGFKQVGDYLSKNLYLNHADEHFFKIDINIVDYKVLLHFAGSQKVILPYHYKFLHQLQNLYFALTGEELEVNL
jgi:hypothetical protein